MDTPCHFGRVFKNLEKKKKKKKKKKSVLSNRDVRAGVGRRLTFLSMLYITFILQWITFMFGKDEEDDQ